MNLRRMIIFLSLVVFAYLLSACAGDESSPADSSWSTASVLADKARYPLIGSDREGNLTAVWVQFGGIYSARFDSNQLVWGPPQRITEDNNFSDIHLAVNAKGDAVVAWVHDGDYPDHFIQTAKYSASSGWSTPQQLTPPNTVVFLDVALDANGNAMIAWSGWDFPEVRMNVFASRSLPTSGWDTPQPIGTNIWNAQFPRIAIDGAGNAFVLWVEGEFTSNNVYANRYTVNSGWGTPQQIATNAGSALWTNIVFDKLGNAMAAWEQTDSNNLSHIYSCKYSVGSGWGNAGIIDNHTLDSIEPALTIDSSESFHVVWIQVNGPGSDIYSSRTLASNEWETPQLIGTGGIVKSIGFASSLRVASDDSGNVFTVWEQRDLIDMTPGDSKLYANRFIAGSGWGTQQQLNNTGAVDAPELAVDPQGHATVIWTQSYIEYHSFSFRIYTSRFQ